MKKRLCRIPFLVSLALVLVSSMPALAWWDEGHRLVAEIAWKELDNTRRSEITELLTHHPDPAVRTLADASVWPDVVRDRAHPFHAYHRSGWHYEDRAIVTEKGDWELDVSGALVAQLERQIQILNDPSKSKPERAVALCWVVHLVGDVHQPLHNAELYGADFPQGDQGGNRFKVILGSQEISLHKLWDSVGGRFLEPVSRQRLQSYRDWFTARFPETQMTEGPALESPAEWSDEGFKLAQDVGYGDLRPGERISSEQLQRVLDVSAERVTLAGYRLAKILRGSPAR